MVGCKCSLQSQTLVTQESALSSLVKYGDVDRREITRKGLMRFR